MTEDFARILARVERPARYSGGELNSARPGKTCTARMALVFPDTYEIGMSHVGMRILYHQVNETADLSCERAFHPWTDMEAELRRSGKPLCTLESGTALRGFPLVGFSIPYELLYGNILNILDLAGIPLYSKDRSDDDPLILAGGPCSFNPEPMVPFLDLVLVGEGEDLVCEICRLASRNDLDRRARLEAMADLDGVYVPSLHRKGRVVQKAWRRNLDETFFPCSPLVPNTDIVHDRANLEIHRGCVHGCRFCQAGYIYRPLRIRSRGKLLDMAHRIVDDTGYEELGLVSLNSVDHPQILAMMKDLNEELSPRRIAIGMPSLRMDAISSELARRLGKTKKTNVTLAPEAGSQRLRDKINKNLSEEQILRSVDAFLEAGWRDMKLYFMIGLPGETDEDVEAIVDLVDKILERGRGGGASRSPGRRTARKKGGGRPFKVVVNVSSFVAKAHTPYQWAAMCRPEVLKKRLRILLNGLSRNRRVSLKWRDFELGLVEGLLARGDRRLSAVVHRVWKAGGVLESWSDRFDFDRWLEALEAEGLALDEYVFRERDVSEALPWDHIDCGVSRAYLLAEWRRSTVGLATPSCLGGECSGCGFGRECPTAALPQEPGGTRKEVERGERS